MSTTTQTTQITAVSISQVIAKNARRVPRGFTLPLSVFRLLVCRADRAVFEGKRGRIRRGLTGDYSVSIVAVEV